MTRRSHRRKKKAGVGSSRERVLEVSESSEKQIRDAETVRLVREAISWPRPDIGCLRRVACERGLVNASLRRQCWPLLLGLGDEPSTSGRVEETLYQFWHGINHRDGHVVVVDVERSLWSFTYGMTERERQVLRDKLLRLLNAAIGRYAPGADRQALDELNDNNVERSSEIYDIGYNDIVERSSDIALIRQQVHYYQGLHDIASVLLMELGGSEAEAFPLLSRLVIGHLRDCTRSSLEPVLELLDLLWPLLDHVDHELCKKLQGLGLPAYFFLSWFITWFAHDCKKLETAARLFDLFLASHPLMPLYVGVTAMRAMRDKLMACEEMHDAHAALSHIDLLTCCHDGDGGCSGITSRPEDPAPRSSSLSGGHGDLERLIGQAIALMDRLPPKALLEHRDVSPMFLCVSPWARLDTSQSSDPDCRYSSTWIIPDATPPEAARTRKRDNTGGRGRLRHLLSNMGWARLGIGGKRGDREYSDHSNIKKKDRPRAIVTLSVVSVYLVAAAVLGYATLRGGMNTGIN